MDDENIFGSFQKSVSAQSNYSDVYEDLELASRNSNKNTSKNQELLNNNLRSFSNINYSNIISKPFPAPEDTKEENIDEFKISNFEMKNTNKIIDEVDEDNNVCDMKNFNNINNINNLNSQKLEEDLYSIRKNSSFFSDKHSSNKILVNLDNIRFNKQKSLAFDKNLKPLEKNIECENDNLNINEYLNINNKKNKEEKKPINKTFKRYKTSNNNEIKRPLASGIVDVKRAISTTNFASNNMEKSNNNHPYFDLKNILKKAVILNGKKGNSNNNSLNKKYKVFPKKIDENMINNGIQINNIEFQNIQIDKININYLKKNFRRIDIETKNKKSNNHYIKTLIELQNFYIENCVIRVIKISQDGHYLAAGCENGKIKIYEIMGYNYSHYKLNYDKENIKEYLNFINEVPYKTLERHKKDIIDLDWSPFYPNLLLSASLDHYACLWDLNEEGKNCLVRSYNHKDVVTSVAFNPKYRNIFISGCLDTFVRIWLFNYEDNIMNLLEDNYIINTDKNINNEEKETQNGMIYPFIKKEKNEKLFENSNTYEAINKTENFNQINNEPINYFNIENKIISLSYFPDGTKIGVGTEKGKIYVYNALQEVNYNNNFFVSKKKFGCFKYFFRSGKKVTNIQFIDNTRALISTSDSYIRLVDMNAGRILYQYKGYVNNISMTRAHADLNDDVIIVGGKDRYCYLWNLYEKTNNNNYIRFKPFSKELIESSLIAHEKCYTYYTKKIFKLTNKVFIKSIIVNGTSEGRLEILLNINESS